MLSKDEQVRLNEDRLKGVKYHCYECSKDFDSENDLVYIDDVQDRVSSGEIMPAGQCPECGFMVSVPDSELSNYLLDSIAIVMRQRGWKVSKPRKKK